MILYIGYQNFLTFFFEKKFVRNQKSSKVLVINVVSDQFLAETILTDFYPVLDPRFYDGECPMKSAM